jgi:hypothetical protein
MSSTNPAAFCPAPEAGSIKSKSDRILRWPLVSTVGCPAAFILICAGPFKLMVVGAPLVLFYWAVAAIVALCAAAAYAYGLSWRRSLSTLIFPLSTLVAAWNFGFVWQTGQLIGAYLHFFAMRPVYLQAVSELPPEKSRFKVFYWHSWFLNSLEVVYDESDEITLPPDRRSADWMKKAEATDAVCEIVGYTAMGSHFYLVSFAC